ncbi:hypothetical protein [Acidisphaera sp. L21]|uniref:hypothetical protein n=1 Tax=Acidisphaera sp. L21 TaxID=1641851 RepID=UPI00131B5AB4|nr:hypothetical protein [Acidisphaera sp. L21]
MQLPFTLPDWAPPWVGFVIIVVGVLFLLAFLLMPFNVFGLKGRLDGVEARLDEIHREIRMLALRLPEPGRTEYEPELDDRRSWREPSSRPPIPPRMAEPDRPPPSPGRRVPPPRQTRAEPRFDQS